MMQDTQEAQPDVFSRVGLGTVIVSGIEAGSSDMVITVVEWEESRMQQAEAELRRAIMATHNIPGILTYSPREGIPSLSGLTVLRQRNVTRELHNAGRCALPLVSP